MTEINVPDPDELPTRADAPAENESPYKNLLVPLVVVPAVIVMALVLVFVLFGAIAGEETTPRENVAKLVGGGANESRQAAFNLMRQVLEDMRAEAEGREGEWGIGPDLIPSLQDALADRLPIEDADEVPIPLALSVVLTHLEDETGLLQLCDFLRLTDELDPDAQYRLQAAMALGPIGGRLSAGRQSLVANRLIELLESPDLGLRLVGTVGLQTYPTPEAVAALEGMLGDASLEIRGCAALALAEQGNDAGVDVLRSLLDLSIYEEERGQMPGKWTRGSQVSDSRQRALAALDRVGQLPAEAELEALAESDPDARIRDLSRTYLARAR